MENRGAADHKQIHQSVQSSRTENRRKIQSNESVTRQEEEGQELKTQVPLQSQEISEKLQPDPTEQRSGDESGEGKTPIRLELSTSEEKEVEVAHNSISECSATLRDKHEQGFEDLASYKANSLSKTLHEIVL
ncbi:hypothetical protein HAX54_032785, partial [Datura stramonium]|nr:hypothetical protein [Datura stramonium]